MPGDWFFLILLSVRAFAEEGRILRSAKIHFNTWTCEIHQLAYFNRINYKWYKKAWTGTEDKVIALKRKVIVDSDIPKFWYQISKLNDTISQLHSINEKN